MKCFFLLAISFTLSIANLVSQENLRYPLNFDSFQNQISTHSFYPAEIRNFFKNYPDIEYSTSYDSEIEDWRIEVTADLYFERETKGKGKKKAVFYWAGGRLLPKEELPNKENYWILQYKYENKLRNPKNFTSAEIERIKNFGSNESRKNTAGTPMFFFDFLYSAQSMSIIEEHIISTTFLGMKTNIHERIYSPLKNVEKKILERSSEKEVSQFISSLKSADAYYWRKIANTSRKSFHSYGIAIDLLPKQLNGKAIYWGHEKARVGDKWMLIPLEKRWIPPLVVRQIFEEEGFIWGGYWIIFDNMHFEYHPELISASAK